MQEVALILYERAVQQFGTAGCIQRSMIEFILGIWTR
jgi:hypothetical protein